MKPWHIQMTPYPLSHLARAQPHILAISVLGDFHGEGTLHIGDKELSTKVIIRELNIMVQTKSDTLISNYRELLNSYEIILAALKLLSEIINT